VITTTKTFVQKRWSHCTVLRYEGMKSGSYVAQ
jgi:hypothetical protein